jgi:hypothetical protein
MRSILSILAVFVFVACENPTAPHNTLEIIGIYVEQNSPYPVISDTVTITKSGDNIEKSVRAIDGGTFAIVSRGTYLYDSATQTLTRQNGNVRTVWHFNGQTLTSGSQTFIKINGDDK